MTKMAQIGKITLGGSAGVETHDVTVIATNHPIGGFPYDGVEIHLYRRKPTKSKEITLVMKYGEALQLCADLMEILAVPARKESERRELRKKPRPVSPKRIAHTE